MRATTQWRYLLLQWVPRAAIGKEFEFQLVAGKKNENEWKEWLKSLATDSSCKLEYVSSQDTSVIFKKVK